MLGLDAPALKANGLRTAVSYWLFLVIKSKIVHSVIFGKFDVGVKLPIIFPRGNYYYFGLYPFIFFFFLSLCNHAAYTT